MKYNSKILAILTLLLVCTITNGYGQFQCYVENNASNLFSFGASGGTMQQDIDGELSQCEEGPEIVSGYTKPAWITNISLNGENVVVTVAQNNTGTNLNETVTIMLHDDILGDLGEIDIIVNQSSGVQYSWYNDADGDGKGAGTVQTTSSSTPPTGTNGFPKVSNDDDLCPNQYSDEPDGCPEPNMCSVNFGSIDGDWDYGFQGGTITRSFSVIDGDCESWDVTLENEANFPSWLSASVNLPNKTITVTTDPFIASGGDDRYFQIDVLFSDLGTDESTAEIFLVQASGFYYAWYPDSDGDTFGDYYAEATLTTTNQSPFTGAVNNNLDKCPTQFSAVNNGCEDPYEDRNWVSSKIFDVDGTLKASSKTYFNDLGKSIQSQSLDIQTNKVWASGTLYDHQGRPAMQTLAAPIYNTPGFDYKSDFMRKTNGQIYDWGDFENSISNPPAAGEQSNSLGWYYSDSNSVEPYQDETDYPFTVTRFSTLNPNQPLITIGGNKINGEWPQAYSFTMPATNELSLSEAFNDPSYQNIKTLKTVSRDVHGVENVVFTDTDGKVLAAARSGADGTTSANMNLYIGEQGYVDVHIPQGITGISSSNNNAVEVYDLIADDNTTTAMSALTNGFYRIAVTDMDNYTPNSIFVSYKVNYYDYSLNEYDDAGRLTDSYQPLDKLHTTYEYNALGQLIKTTSPDEGTAEFKYRSDGQIRYSQNSEQKLAGEVSFTDYDAFGRPLQSGVVSANFDTLDPDDQSYTVPYDEFTSAADDAEHNLTFYDQRQLEVSFFDAKEEYKSSFLSGNVSSTANLHAQTFYGYDVYGRVKWVAMEIKGLSANYDDTFKTIHYTYDPITGLVTHVDYQKDTASERFIHRYTYNELDQLEKVETSTNGSNYTTQAEYEYYETGGLKRTELADGIQGIDYVYNLAGQLKSINHPSINNAALDPGGDSNNLFGMQLDYHGNDYARSSATNITSPSYGTDQLNGNIKGIRWQNSGSNTGEAVYAYTYDRNNWLTSADFGADGIAQAAQTPPLELVNEVVLDGNSELYENPTSITIKPTSHFETGSDVLVAIKDLSSGAGGEYDVANITYDPNGNIQTLIRNQNDGGAGSGMDNLSYNYEAGTNQLNSVDDAVTVATGVDDIKDQDSDNYEYNEIGQLVRNNAEDIDYLYNARGLVTEVKKEGETVVKFYYNERNQRIRKETVVSGSITFNTYYVRDIAGQVMAIYSDQSGSMALVEQPIYGSGRIGVAYVSSSAVENRSYVYELTDHLGNVRVVFKKDNTDAQLEGYTDYYPFGMTMPDRIMEDANQYRYGYQGQYAEKDEETGKEAFELRLWDSRIGRWLSPDPYGQFHSPYLGMGNNPIAYNDPDGGCIKNGKPCNASRTGERVVGDGGAVWEYDGDTWGLHWTYAVELEGFTGTPNGEYSFRDWQSDMQNFRAQQFEEMALQHRKEFNAGRRAYGAGVAQIIQIATLPISIAELAVGGTALVANSRNGALLADDVATVFTHGADDVLYTQYQNLGTAGRSVFNFADEVGYAAHQIKPTTITGSVLNFGRGAVDATFYTGLNTAPVLYQAPSAFRVSLAASNAMFAPYAYYLRHTSSFKR